MIKKLINYFSLVGQLWHDKVVTLFFRWAVIVSLGQLLAIILFFNSLPPQIPLFRSLVWGESQLVVPSLLFLLPIFSVTIILINSFLAFIFQRHQLLTRLLIITSLIFSLICLVPIIQIILLFS